VEVRLPLKNVFKKELRYQHNAGTLKKHFTVKITATQALLL
jgi:hypothetical protein